MFSGILFSRGPSPSTARSWLVLCAMSMLQFFIAVDVTVVNIALPSIGADFGVGDHALTWVVVGYTIAGGGLLMLGGRLGDLLGRRRVLLAGTTLFGTASLLAGLAPSFGLLVLARSCKVPVKPSPYRPQWPPSFCSSPKDRAGHEL